MTGGLQTQLRQPSPQGPGAAATAAHPDRGTAEQRQPVPRAGQIGPVSGMLQCVLVAGLMGCAARTMAPAFDRPSAQVCLVVVAVLAAAVPLGRRHLSVASAIATGFVATVAVALAIMIGWRWPGGATASPPRALATVWVRLLTTHTPMAPTPDLIVGPAMVIFALTFAGCWLALRSRAALAPVGPCLLALGIALAMAAAPGPHERWPATLFAALSITLIAVRADLGSPIWVRGPAGVAIGVVAAACAWAASLTGIVPGTDRKDPRDLARPPAVQTSARNPLEDVKRQLLQVDPSVSLFTVRLTPTHPPVDRVTVATLGTFDGARWLDTAQLEPYGPTLPTDPSAHPRASATVSGTVTIDQLEGPFLPVIDRPTSVGGVSVAFEPSSATLFTNAWKSGLSYRFTSQVVTPSRTDLAQAVPESGPAVAAYLPSTAAPLPQWVQDLAKSIVARVNTPYSQLARLQSYLSGPHFPYDIGAPPGDSLAIIQQMLTASDPQARSGHSEQHAAAFALLARALGYPTRIAVGYLLERDSAEPNEFHVTSREAHAWPEVDFANIGWVPFEPTDVSKLNLHQPPSPLNRPENGPVPPGVQARPEPPVIRPDLAPYGSDRFIGLSRLQVLLLVALTPVLLLTLLAGGVVAEKKRRRLVRHRRSEASDRIMGAWEEVLDRLDERGLSIEPGDTAADVAAAAREHFRRPTEAWDTSADEADRGWDSLDPLGAIVTSALFHGAEPTAQEAVDAWNLQAEVHRTLVSGEAVADRLRALLSLRPLLPARLRRQQRPVRRPARSLAREA
ncbi:transglutaminase domain-containing protein [Pseudofrankia inefficax]|uniref:Transglutaminase domain-containing protein n=1 Tax=Pseudofrankia inefficax (strain DSM 45817 / CECT 9037 / DDB 130130 / EuI1c) TaxID=298654 RepID=E3IWI2_PSEI1|nr:transglutaminase domain-containing protein [Pseudofrankia inefficax]ADP80165.1 transglutaminase domain-containing protein [Pseudofrankia inefficax]